MTMIMVLPSIPGVQNMLNNGEMFLKLMFFNILSIAAATISPSILKSTVCSKMSVFSNLV